MKRITLAAIFALTLLPGCDWIQYAFMNSIPFHGTPTGNPDVYVYLGLDGLSYRSVLSAQAQGAFTGGEWRASKFMNMFPATSDASWTRILHTEKLGGYEFEYYDPTSDTLVNEGLFGVALHIIPNIAEPLNLGAKYLTAWDNFANGYGHDIGAYHDTFFNLTESTDNIFFLLDGRAETETVFSAYMLEFDVLGHMQKPEDITSELVKLSKRIDEFKSHHPERHFHFTIISDHGMDFIPVKHDHLVVLHDEMAKVGVTKVEKLAGHDPETETYAIPVEHTRVTYVALHTHPKVAPRAAQKLSKLPSIDFGVARAPAPADAPVGRIVEWYGLWSDGEPVIIYAYDSASDHYLLPASGNYGRLGYAFTPTGAYTELTDDALFAMTKDTGYPDLFYRVRTSLMAIGVKYPADLFVTFKPGFVSLGFQLPGGGDDVATQGFHGGLDALGSVGSLLTEEKEVPDAVRADDFLKLFPRMREHILRRGVTLRD